jgi:hypothetical protein
MVVSIGSDKRITEIDKSTLFSILSHTKPLSVLVNIICVASAASDRKWLKWTLRHLR